jgi:hypothetical protein
VSKSDGSSDVSEAMYARHTEAEVSDGLKMLNFQLKYGVLTFNIVCSRSSHCALYLQGMEEGEDNSKLGEASCVTRFIRMLLSLVSYISNRYYSSCQRGG